MADINKVEKTSNEAIRIDYTSKDYVAILDDLINSIPGITQKWKSTDMNDPGMILVRLMAIVGDMLFYNQDMQSLEIYPSSVTQRKNAADIYRLIGYKMNWYRSASLYIDLVNTYSSSATVPRFCMFSTEDGINYTTFYNSYVLNSNTTNNGSVTTIELTQGTPVVPARVSNQPFPEVGKPWHSIYGYNYSVDDIVDCRIYLEDNDIDQNHIIVIDDQNEVWELMDNIYLTTAVGRFFEMGVDNEDNVYIELIDYYTNFNISKFKIFYIKSDGEKGQINANTLKYIYGNIWSQSNTDDNTYNVSNFVYFTHSDSTEGYDPETPDEARKNSKLFQNTLDTIITLADFERAVLREPGVANVRATDLTNDPGETISFSVGNINMDYTEMPSDNGVLRSEIIDENDVNLLENYLNYQDNIKQEYPNPEIKPVYLSAYQKSLADCDQDGEPLNEKDLQCLRNYLENAHLELDQKKDSGAVGIKQLTETQQLEGFTVKLYILRDEIGDTIPVDVFESQILSDLQDYKILPLTIKVDLESIHRYYWTVKGTFFTRQPLSRDELQNIIININDALRHKYAIDKMNFNSIINYKEVIETILAVDSRILMVDLDPIKYRDWEGNDASKEAITGNYQYTEPVKDETLSDSTHYIFKLPNAPILPGSVMIRINFGQYTLRDNNNGQIYNVDNILAKKGTIDYRDGTIELYFNDNLDDDIIVDYTKNVTNVALYNNLNTQTFYFDKDSLEKDDMQDLV